MARVRSAGVLPGRFCFRASEGAPGLHLHEGSVGRPDLKLNSRGAYASGTPAANSGGNRTIPFTPCILG